jgi:hypothetical protein
MADATEVRAWAVTEGYTVSERGQIPRTIREAYDAAHPGANGTTTLTDPDYPDDDFESAFADMPEDLKETPPRKPAKPAGKGTRSLFRRPKAAGGKKRPRVSTEGLLTAVWRGAAKLATPLPPLHRTLRVQAPVAGLLLEDAVKGTVVDAFLQPLARYAERGKAVQALMGPPVMVTAISLHLARAEAAGEEPNPLFMSVATEGLRSSLMVWAEVAGPKFEVAVQKEKDFEDKYGGSVDDLIAMLFAAPVNPADAVAVAAEDEAIRRAQGVTV